VFHWEVLIIPAIALVVWILTTLFRGENAPLPPRRENDDSLPKRRPVTPLDRTLDEARRRRQQQPVKRPAPPEVKRPVMLEEVRRPPRSPAKPIVLALAEPEPPRAEYAAPPAPSVATAPPAPAEVSRVARQPASPMLLQVRQLLRSPRSAAAGFVLREILDTPRCRRRRS
jgi:hypothetical protein